MAPRLRVFVTSDGLTDYVVAVSSKAKALEAWGVRQDVFKEGAAHQTDDPDLMKAALAQAGEVLRRPAGTRETMAKVKKATTTKRASGPSKVQLKKAAMLERQLTALDTAHDRAAAALERARADLDRREEDLHAAHETQRGKLEASLNAARQPAA